MKKIGVRDLKSRLTAVIRAVREDAVEYTVTVHGQPVAVIRPYTVTEEADCRSRQIADELSRLDQLAGQIGENWAASQAGVDILEEMREESACR
ncbi:MAG: type II toxin-antitoxin system Phd/YefM family antitoxin [Caldilineaceae bacterium]|nr:type II toxin-antitoxin system Phd/YefM family antitoxin [Caldilineaceae bacterium]